MVRRRGGQDCHLVVLIVDLRNDSTTKTWVEAFDMTQTENLQIGFVKKLLG